MRRLLGYSLIAGLGVLGLLAWSVSVFVDDSRDYCGIGPSADLGWWPPRYTCTYSWADGTTRTVTDPQWDVIARPAAILVLLLAAVTWIAILRWKPPLACAIAGCIGVGITLVLFPLGWAQAAEDFCSSYGRSWHGPNTDLFPPTFTCEFLRADGSTFTRDFHSHPSEIVIGTALFGLVGVVAFSIAAWKVRKPRPVDRGSDPRRTPASGRT